MSESYSDTTMSLPEDLRAFVDREPWTFAKTYAETWPHEYLVRDRVGAERAVTARSRLHLHPNCELLEVDATRARVRHPGGEFQVCFAGAGELSVESAHYCPEFGKRMDGRALVFTSRGANLETGFCVAKGGAAVGYDLVTGASVNGARYVF